MSFFINASLTNFSNLIFKQTLRELDLSKNKIEVLDEKISKLFNLKKIWINDLQLKTLPEYNLFANSLKCIYAYSNIVPASSTDKNYLNLTKIRGNSINAFKLFSKPMASKNKTLASKNIKNKIFISYSHKDEIWLNKLQIHLKVLSNHLNVDMDVWDDKRLVTGDDWKSEIINALNNSGIAIMLISTDFLASDFINKEEIPSILENAEKNGTRILPIIVKPCLFLKTKISKYQALNPPSNPFSKLLDNDVEEYLVKLSEEIFEMLS